MNMENFSFKYFKIVKNALLLKKAHAPSRMIAKKVNIGGYLLFIVQSERVKCYLLVRQILIFNMSFEWYGTSFDC